MQYLYFYVISIGSETMIKKYNAIFCFEPADGKETDRWYINVKDKWAVFREKTVTVKNIDFQEFCFSC